MRRGIVAGGMWGGCLHACLSLSVATEVVITEMERQVEPETREKIQRVVEVMTRFHEAYAKLPERIEIKIRLFQHQHEYRRYRDSQGVSGRADWGYYSPRDGEMVVYEKKFRWEQTMIHEAAHHINHVAVGRMPTALNEGIAQFFESGYPRGSRIVFRPKKAELANVKKWQRVGHLPRLREFLETSYQDYYQKTHETRGSRTYDIAYALVYYLMGTADHRQVIRRLLARLKAGETDIATILEEEYPGGINRLEHDWMSFLRKPFSEIIFTEDDGFTR